MMMMMVDNEGGGGDSNRNEAVAGGVVAGQPKDDSEDDDDDCYLPGEDVLGQLQQNEHSRGINRLLEEYSMLNDPNISQYAQQISTENVPPPTEQQIAYASGRELHDPHGSNICTCDHCINNNRYHRRCTSIDYEQEIDVDELVTKHRIDLGDYPECKQVLEDWKNENVPGRKYSRNYKRDEDSGSEADEDEMNVSDDDGAGEDEDEESSGSDTGEDCDSDAEDESEDEEDGDDAEDESDVDENVDSVNPSYQHYINTEYDEDNIPEGLIVLKTSHLLGAKVEHGGTLHEALKSESMIELLVKEAELLQDWDLPTDNRATVVARRGEKIIEIITELRNKGNEFLMVEKRERDDKIVYKAPPKVTIDSDAKFTRDEGSLRTKLYRRVYKKKQTNTFDAQANKLALLQKLEEKTANRVIGIITNDNKLGTLNPYWVPSFYPNSNKNAT